MNQTFLSKDESPLFDNAISKLRPRVFSHPVWIRFGYTQEPNPHATIKSLLAEIENLQKESPSDACQVLLLCAVFQHYSGQSADALATIQTARNLANRNDLTQEMMWALWGSSAICVQQKNFQPAITFLTTLIRMLKDQGDWILAGFVEEVKQALKQEDPTERLVLGWPLNYQSSGNLLARTFHWLNNWGFSAHLSHRNIHSTRTRELPNRIRPLFSWRSLRLIFRGELKINWMGVSPSTDENRFSAWGFIRSLLQRHPGPGVNDQDVIDIPPNLPEGTGVSIDSSDPPGTIEESEIDLRPVEAYPPASVLVQETFPSIPISAHMLGDFNISIQETNLKAPSSRSLSLFKYLLLHHKQHTPREVLMEVFWPDAESETARNNLNVAIHGLRRAIRSVVFLPVIVFKEGSYGFEDTVEVWLDVEEFERCASAGQRMEARNHRTAAIAEYEAAISLYQGDFLKQNPYEEWTVLERERLRITYLETLDRLSHIYFGQERYAMCITVCKLILTRDRCREDAHSLLMRCYSRQGQDHLALRQYQICVEALRMELDVAPAPETTKLYEQVRQHKRV